MRFRAFFAFHSLHSTRARACLYCTFDISKKCRPISEGYYRSPLIRVCTIWDVTRSVESVKMHQYTGSKVCYRDAEYLLVISYKFVKGFLAITFLLLVFSSWNFHDVCQRFLYGHERKFSWIRQKVRIFPIDPHYKNRQLLYRHVYRHDVTKEGDFYNGGIWGKSPFFCRTQLIFFPGYITKTLTHIETAYDLDENLLEKKY